MNAPEFAGVMDSLRPLLWALALCIILVAAVWAVGRVLPVMGAKREPGPELM